LIPIFLIILKKILPFLKLILSEFLLKFRLNSIHERIRYNFKMKKAIDLTILILSKFTALALSVLILLIVYDATMRYLFSEGSTALQELEWHLFDVVILLSIAYTLKMNSHVRVDILYDKFPKKIQKYIDIIAIVFFILPFSFFIIYVSYDFVAMSLLQNEASSDPGGLPYRWIVKSLILIAFFMLALQSVRNLIEDIKELKKW